MERVCMANCSSTHMFCVSHCSACVVPFPSCSFSFCVSGNFAVSGQHPVEELVFLYDVVSIEGEPLTFRLHPNLLRCTGCDIPCDSWRQMYINGLPVVVPALALLAIPVDMNDQN